jgi:hypothetical protein
MRAIFGTVLDVASILRSGPKSIEKSVLVTAQSKCPPDDGCLRGTPFYATVPNEVEAYRVGPKAFDYKGNGFMITIDIASKGVKTME